MTGLRQQWTCLTDDQLLAQCAVDTYRASGPGGQKRNKTSSAVRLRHEPSGLIVIAEESRSQHENKAKALKRLQKAFFLELRNAGPFTQEGVLANPDWPGVDRLDLGVKNPRFWPAAGVVLDVLLDAEAQVSTAAERLGVTTANLVDFLRSDPKLWQTANQMRIRFGHSTLR